MIVFFWLSVILFFAVVHPAIAALFYETWSALFAPAPTGPLPLDQALASGLAFITGPYWPFAYFFLIVPAAIAGVIYGLAVRRRASALRRVLILPLTITLVVSFVGAVIAYLLSGLSGPRTSQDWPEVFGLVAPIAGASAASAIICSGFLDGVRHLLQRLRTRRAP